MLIQCRPLFMGEADSLSIDTELDFSQVEFQGAHPFVKPIHVVGGIKVRAGVVQLSARAVFDFDGQCDRCLAPYTRSYDVPVEHTLVTTLENEENDDYILLELPYKTLCREDCRGLCTLCGKNLNEGLCGCNHKSVDPRLAVLRQLLD